MIIVTLVEETLLVNSACALATSHLPMQLS